jgi:hypothetical protein
MSDAETKTVVGQCVEIEQKPGSEWVGFKINVGTQYPVKLSTKKQEIIDAGRAVGSEVATWTFKETQGNENPNRPGTYYMNRYLDKVEVGEQAATASGTPAQTSPVPTPHHEPIAPADKDRAITRMSCLSSAAALLQGVVFENEGQRIAGWVAAAAAAERHVYRDIEAPDYDPDIPF